jgi:hypothetical protein
LAGCGSFGFHARLSNAATLTDNVALNETNQTISALGFVRGSYSTPLFRL